MEIKALLSNIRLTNLSLESAKIETESFTYYSISLDKFHEDLLFEWKINRTLNEIFKLKSNLEPFLKHIPLSKSLPSKKVFSNILSEEDRIIQLKDFLSFIIISTIPSPYLLEFLEISSCSFKFTEKLKEGYVFKYGSGRKTNQKRCFNFLNKFFNKKKKMWLRLLPDGIEYSKTNESENVIEVINFCQDFRIEYGWCETGQICGINIITNQHKFLFTTENLLCRDEFVKAIKSSFSQSEFNIGQIRFNSSFIERDLNGARYYIDGCDFFASVCDSLRKARMVVCITDWWLSPEVYLKRPSTENEGNRLVDVLGEIADRGVQVYVLLYKELTFTIAINSLYTKRILQSRSPNIRVIRHPGLSFRGGELLWSHHSKIVCVDESIAFIGGLDLCYGRWDTPEHKLVDLEANMWPGIDYVNVRLADYGKVDQWKKDRINRNLFPRMPWHDISVSVTGMIVKDIWTHFIQLWNHIIKDITGSKNKEKIINLAQSRVYTNGKRQTINARREKSKVLFKSFTLKFLKSHESKKSFDNTETNVVISKRNSQTINEKETRAFMSSNDPKKKFSLLEAFKSYLQKKILDPYPEHVQSQDENIEEQLLCKNEEEKKDEMEINEILAKNTNDLDIFQLEEDNALKYINISERKSIDCQLVRSASSWSLGLDHPEDSIHTAYQSLILEAKKFIYIENQFFISNSAGKPVQNQIAEAIIKRIEKAIMCSENFRVIIVIPLLPAFEGSVDDPTAAVLRVQLHYEYKTICRGKKSILSQVKMLTPHPEKYIKFYSLRTHALLNGQPITEMIYVHSKLMVIDDTTVLVGSANINDRSLLGERDAEICLVMRDNESESVRFEDDIFECSKFGHSLRMDIFKEMSGSKKTTCLENPFSVEFFKKWDKRASDNTKIYRKIFRCYPDDNIKNLSEVRDFMNKAQKEKYQKLSKKIKGHLVEFPLTFLENENLNITVNQKEYLLPDITFT